ncbi:response regulator [Roseomonas sp. KE2513]|uniref:HWE histidine kinase domain-containing protein n=1 Tax=Roseomonas sp. KE2513 TaxID=2479202 RepID=UPI0018DF569B|nr:HWE histidine kinase domain-containing protein [Roseomonas sp. KE2513]MBI0534411.1 response regulator [Roseomonas sp. KE2513]
MTEARLAPATESADCRILHLEDSAIDAELIAEYLAHSGLASTIQLVVGRAEFTAALLRGEIDLILADFVLPDFDGLTALSVAREIAPDTPFIFVSGTMGEEAAVEAVRQGATDYVVKQRLARLPIAVRRAQDDARARDGQRETLAALRESEARLRLALEAGRLGTWELDLRSGALTASAHFHAAFGGGAEGPFTYPDLLAAIHAKDRECVQSALARSVSQHADYDVEYRAVQSDGTVRWLQVRGRPVHAPDGTALGLAGVSLDITERKLAEERQTLLSREVDHRAKNALAVVQATLRLTKVADVPGYIRAVEGRVAALVRAQALLVEDRWAGADLRALLEGELLPFLGTEPGRAVLQGPRVSLPVSAVQPLAMIAHELATNAVKYGALSAAEGCVSVSWQVERGDDNLARLKLRWAESGGPPLHHVPKRRGFGGRMLESAVRVQLSGEVALLWEPEGLVCEIQMPLESSPAEALPASGDRNRLMAV